MASGGAARGKAERRKRANTDARWRSHSTDDPYDYTTLTDGDRFDIPEGEDKEEWIQFFDEASRATREVIARYGDGRPADRVNRAAILPNRSHHDGSIYGVAGGWHRDYRVSDRGETRLEPMPLSDPAGCFPDQENCILHIAGPLMQFFSIKLAKISGHDAGNGGGPVQVYGYIAARDSHDQVRNYVVNRSRDDPFTFEQGSLIEMSGPKRRIVMRSAVLIEYDMRIKRGDDEEDDLQLIDGVSHFDELTTPIRKPFLSRIHGELETMERLR